MQILYYIFITFAAIAALDRVFGSKLGLGTEFERGVSMAGPLVLAMGGMLVLVPVISELLSGIAGASGIFFDFSLIPAVLLANDMGASQLAMSLAAAPEIGLLNGMVVSSMMGCTVSFLIPYVLQVTDKTRHGDVVFGLLCGITTIPAGVFAGGLILGVGLLPLFCVLLPLLFFAGLIALGILKFEKITVRIFILIGWIIKAVITFGLFVGIVDFLTGFEIIPGIEPLENVMKTIVSILCIMVGVLPLLSILKKILKKPLSAMGKLLGINDASSLGMFVTLGTCLSTFEMSGEMDRRGLIFNSAFAVSASFMFIDHLAWTLSVAPETTLAVVSGKLVSGIAAVAFAFIMCRRKCVD